MINELKTTPREDKIKLEYEILKKYENKKSSYEYLRAKAFINFLENEYDEDEDLNYLLITDELILYNGREYVYFLNKKEEKIKEINLQLLYLDSHLNWFKETSQYDNAKKEKKEFEKKQKDLDLINKNIEHNRKERRELLDDKLIIEKSVVNYLMTNSKPKFNQRN